MPEMPPKAAYCGLAVEDESTSQPRSSSNTSALRRSAHPKKEQAPASHRLVKPDYEACAAPSEGVLHLQQSTRRYRGAATDPTEDNFHGGAATTSTTNLIEQLHAMTSQLHELKSEQQGHNDSARKLEREVREGEEALGRMLRELLTLERAIPIRERHIREDKEKLGREQAASAAKGEQIAEVMTRICNLTLAAQRGGAAPPHH